MFPIQVALKPLMIACLFFGVSHSRALATVDGEGTPLGTSFRIDQYPAGSLILDLQRALWLVPAAGAELSLVSSARSMPGVSASGLLAELEAGRAFVGRLASVRDDRGGTRESFRQDLIRAASALSSDLGQILMPAKCLIVSRVQTLSGEPGRFWIVRSRQYQGSAGSAISLEASDGEGDDPLPKFVVSCETSIRGIPPLSAFHLGADGSMQLRRVSSAAR